MRSHKSSCVACIWDPRHPLSATGSAQWGHLSLSQSCTHTSSLLHAPKLQPPCTRMHSLCTHAPTRHAHIILAETWRLHAMRAPPQLPDPHDDHSSLVREASCVSMLVSMLVSLLVLLTSKLR